MAYFVALHLPTFGMSRFRLSLVPFLFLAAAGLIVAAKDGEVDGRPRRIGLAAALTLLLVWLWSLRWSGVFDVFS